MSDQATTCSSGEGFDPRSGVTLGTFDDASRTGSSSTHADAASSPPKLHCICKRPSSDPSNPDDESDDDFMVQCDICTHWFHGDCVDMDEVEGSRYETWHCPNCALYHGPSQLKHGLRKRRRQVGDFVALNEAPVDHAGGTDMVEIDYVARLKVRHKSKAFADAAASLTVMKDGEAFTSRYADRHGFDQPVLVKKANPKLGLSVPESSFSIADVARLTGEYRVLKVIDVSTQMTLEYSMKEWAEYMGTPPSDRRQVLNLISFEFSRTPMNDLVRAPKFVTDADFVGLNWPNDPSLESDRPHVGKYCLMGAEGSYTDFHVDFGGTSVWYHVFQGMKMFYFIRPTRSNLKTFSDWSVSGSKQGRQFLGDIVSECYKVTVSHGQTLFIPSGWIHAVYTPRDSLVFGGNFVHKHSLEMQLDIYKLEKRMKVRKEYTFPSYETLMWHTASRFVEDNTLEGVKSQPPHVLRGYRALANQLLKWAESAGQQHRTQFSSDMDVLNIAKRLDDTMKQCTTEMEVKEKPVMSKTQSPKVKRGMGKKTESKGGAKREIPKGMGGIGEKAGSENQEKDGPVSNTIKSEPLPAKLAAQNDSPKGNVRGGGVTIEDEEVFWAQCDECNEWREVPWALGGEESSFSCKDVDEACRAEATLWSQCERCREWHVVCHALDRKAHFSCIDLGKQCAVKPPEIMTKEGPSQHG